MLSETVDQRIGVIRAAGHLTALGADLLRGTADSLREGGHRRVVVDLAGVRAADDDGLAVLRSLRAGFAADGGELVLRHAGRLLA
jgi:anti-anti-sigma regulatory factor